MMHKKIILLLFALMVLTGLQGQVRLKQIQHSDTINQMILTDTNGRQYYYDADSLGIDIGITSKLYAEGQELYYVFNKDTSAVFLNICGDGGEPGSTAPETGGSGCDPYTVNEYNTTSNIEDKPLDSGTIKTSSIVNTVSVNNLSECLFMKGFYAIDAKFHLAGAQVATYILRLKASEDSGAVTTIAEKRIYHNVGDYEGDFYLSKKVPISMDVLGSKTVSIQAELEIVDLGVTADQAEWISIDMDLSIYASSNFQ